MNKSIWYDTKIEYNYEKLKENIDVDILVIGGGITGINILYNLKDEDVILVEKNKIACGITRNTTGKLTYFQENTFLNLINKNVNKATIYLKSQLDALNYANQLIKENNIECDLEMTKSYIYTNNIKNEKKLKKLKNFFLNNGIKIYENDMPLMNYAYSISSDNTYLFNPIKYINGLLNKIDKNKIYENTSVIDIKEENDKYICKTKNGIIKANKIILATHYPYFIFPYIFPIKSSLEKSYIISYKELKPNISLISIDNPVTSFRTYKDNIIYLTNSRNNVSNVNDYDNFKDLFIDKKITHIWSNIDIMTNDYIPYIGYIKKNFIIATGFNTWGMTNSVLCGMIIKDIINNKKTEYVKLFNPKINIYNIKILSNAFNSIKGYYEGIKNKNNKIKYVKLNGEKVMIYENKIYKRKCPHLKCNLLFNNVEKTFDCPCHGSRFDINGKCFNGPSNYDIIINEDK